jgi:hypothetical protein
MSSSYSTNTKGKKLRRRSTTKKGPALSRMESMFNDVVGEHGALDEKFKDEKYYQLLRRLALGRVTYSTVQRIGLLPEERLVCGSIGAVFKANSPLRSLISMRHASLPDKKASKFTVIATKVNELVLLIDSSGGILQYDPKKMIYGELVGFQPLPPDLRKWDAVWSKNYLRASVQSNNRHDVSNPLYPQESWGGGVSQLHQIRRINKNPSKKQKQPSRKAKQVYNMDELAIPVFNNPNY